MKSWSGVAARIRGLWTLTRAGAARASRALFGTWSPPPWVRWSGTRAAGFGALVAGHPARSAAALAGLIALGALAHYGYKWYLTRPQPLATSFAVTAPARTEIENELPPNPLVVRFAHSSAPLAMIGKEFTAGITVTPPVVGLWRWVDDKTLDFRPTADWPVGAEYKVALGQKAVADHVTLKEREFKFMTPEFKAAVERASFYQDPTQPAAKKAVFELRFTHPVESAELEKRLELQLAGQAEGVWGVGRERTRFTVSYDKFRLQAYVHSEPLAMPQEDSSITLQVAKGVASSRGGRALDTGLTRAVRVPGRASLKVAEIAASVAHDNRNEPGHVLVARLSATTHEKDIRAATRAWLLPTHHPDPQKGAEPFAWSDPKEITAEVLKLSKKVDLELVAGELEHGESHGFRYDAPIGRHVYVQVEPGLKSFGGYTLAKRVQHIVRVPPFPPQLSILGQGALVSLSGEKKVAVLVRDLPGVRMEIARVLPGQLQHLVTQAGGSFQQPQFTGSVGPDHLAERFERKIPLNVKPGKAHYEALNLGEYLKKDGVEKRGVFLLKVQGYDPRTDTDAAPVREAPEAEPDEEPQHGGEADRGDPSERQDVRLVLVTDLGLLAKRSLDGTQDVFVQSIASGQPVAGAEVEVIGKNGLVLVSRTTDASGRAQFERLDGLTRERTPLMYVVRKAGDLSFLPLNRRDRGLDYSRFDVGGIQNTLLPGKLSAYLFSDRGIYRPGDTFHVGLVVKAAQWGPALTGIPLEVEVIDPRGLPIKREKLKLAAGGFNEIAHTTLETSPTGTYTVNLYLARDGQGQESLGSTTVRVQEFLPDRMKVTAKLSEEVSDGWVHPKDLKAKVSVQNLFGTPAENRRVDATLTLRPAFPSFRAFPDHKFHDPLRAKEGYSDKLAEDTTDEKGEADFELDLGRYAKATYRLHFLARAFEPEGGRSVAADVASLVSERTFLVGFKPDGDLAHVSRGAQRFAHLVAVDSRARKTEVKDLKLEWVERRFVSVLAKQQNGTYRYESRAKEVLLKETALAIPAAGHNLPLEAANAGQFSYRIRDAEGLEVNRIDYAVAGAGNVTRSLERNAELQLTVDRKSYAPGDEIEVSIRAPYAGAGLITIERDKVYAHQWFKTSKQATAQKIRVPAGLEGGGYVSVQFVRDPSSNEIFTSPLSYGVVPFSIDLDKRTNRLTLESPAKVRPGERLRIQLGAAQPTRAVVFAVDEGILQVAQYKTPDPLSHFFQKRQLDVRTSQILDLILPEFKKLMQASAPGGDAESALGRNLNPFKRKREKPAVYWSGIVDVNDKRELFYEVPDTFNGSLRLIAVAVNDGAIGVAQHQTLVQGDFVLLPNAPLAVAPGDEFEVSVGVANNVAGSGSEAGVIVALKPAPHLELLGAATQNLKIGERREGVAIYRLKARSGSAAKLGSAALEFSATLSDPKSTARARLTTDLSVRPATPHYTTVSVGRFSGSAEHTVKRDVHAEFRQAEAAVSPIPLVLAAGLTAYLDTFSHACTEQLTSQAMPAIILGRRPEFGRADASPAPARKLERAIAVLRSRQNAEGGFGLWTASVEADPYASVYALHMLLEARERGYAVPADLMKKGNEYLHRLAAAPATDLHDVRTGIYAVYLLTRQGVVMSGQLTALRETLDKKYPKAWQQDSIAAFLAATYKLLKDERQGAKLMEAPFEALSRRGEPFNQERYYDPLVRDAQILYLASRHFPERTRKLSLEALESLLRPIASGRFNTHSAAYVILALDAYAAQVDNKLVGKLSITEIARNGATLALPLPENLIPRVGFSTNAAKLRFGSDSSLPAYYAVTESGFDKAPPATELKSGLEVVREYLNAEGKPITSVRIGEEIVVKLSFRAIGRPFIENVALVDLLPGGFEPVLHVQQADGTPDPTGVSRLGSAAGWSVQYADVREERVVMYGTVTSSISHFTYRIRATNVGSFVVPPAYGESLYQRDVQARSLPGRITVERKAR